MPFVGIVRIRNKRNVVRLCVDILVNNNLEKKVPIKVICEFVRSMTGINKHYFIQIPNSDIKFLFSMAKDPLMIRHNVG